MFTYLTFIVNSLYNNKDPCHTDKSLLFCIIIKTHERIFSGGSASAGSEAKVSRGGISHEYSSPFPVQTCPTASAELGVPNISAKTILPVNLFYHNIIIVELLLGKSTLPLFHWRLPVVTI